MAGLQEPPGEKSLLLDEREADLLPQHYLMQAQNNNLNREKGCGYSPMPKNTLEGTNLRTNAVK